MDIRLIGDLGHPERREGGVFREEALIPVRDGVTFVTGPDGAAKKRLVRLLTLSTVPRPGILWLDGEDVHSLLPEARAQVRRRIGYAPGGTELPEQVPVRSGLKYLASLWRVPGTVSVQRELERWGLAGLSRRPLGSLSPGQRRRFVLAASLCMAPELWVLVEPLEGLDVPGRALLESLWVDADLGFGPSRHVVVVLEDPNTGPESGQDSQPQPWRHAVRGMHWVCDAGCVYEV